MSITEQINGRITRIGVPLAGNPLRELNAYFVRGRDRDFLVDTGFRTEDCLEALMEGLRDIGWNQARTDILLTHLHSDHSGLAADAAGKHSRVYLSRRDLDYMRLVNAGKTTRTVAERFLEEGFPENLVEENLRNNPAMKARCRVIDDRFIPIDDGAVLDAGDVKLRMVLTPGHTPGNSMFWLEEDGIMFTGDHVLFTITPNITSWTVMKDALGDYLDSLVRVRNYPVRLALPGHRERGDYGGRIDSLIHHHLRRLEETEGIVRRNPGFSGYDIAGHMTWRIRAKNWDEFPVVQKWFAMGEALAHLDYLVLRGKILRDENFGLHRYYPVEENQKGAADTDAFSHDVLD